MSSESSAAFPLADGYWNVPPGKLIMVVTSLIMHHKPPLRPVKGDITGLSVVPVLQPPLDWYRALYRKVGEDWLWFSRLRMSEEELTDIIHDPDVKVFSLQKDGVDLGLLELDFRAGNKCELAFFGIAPELIGSSAGRFLMNEALAAAFAQPIEHLWVHTCTLDHPNALNFYQRSGFVPFQRLIEVADDPRLTGEAPRHSATHVPLL
jgi:N-acetylglutamate synthase-like GNAT family acetyltransferase